MDSTSSGKMSGNGSEKAGRHQARTNGDTRDKLMSDMKTVIGEAERMLKDDSTDSAADSDGFVKGNGATREQFQQALETTKNDLMRLETDLLEKTKAAAQATDAYVQAHPWTAVGLGAAFGAILGLLISRK